MATLRRALPAAYDATVMTLLLEREQVLRAEARDLIGSSIQRHCKIQKELAEIHRQLEGFARRGKELL